MNDLVIKVSKRSRLIDLDHSTLGIVGENLQEKLIFTFQDEFVDGMARLEYELDSEKHYVLMEKVGQSYILPVQNVLLTKEGNIDLQLVITEDKTGTPVFKSEVFTLYCKKSIEAVGEAPSSYELWIEKANRILLEASRVNIDGNKTGNETIITITQRDGNKKSFPILDGEQGPQGPQGPVGPQGPEGPQGPVGPTPDLTNYVKNTDYATSSKGGVITTSGQFATAMSGSSLYAVTRNFETYQTMANGAFIGKGTLENVITGKQLVNQTTLESSQAEQDTTIEELQAELDRYKLLENALPHVSNETPSDYVTLENTAKSPMEVSLTPQTSQETTTGKNLLNTTGLTTQTISGVTFTPVYENELLLYIEANGTATAGLNYYIQRNYLLSESGTFYITDGIGETGGENVDSFFIFCGLGGGGRTYSNNGAFTISDSSISSEIRIVVRSGITLNNVKFYPMISKTLNDSYEPYTGGIPSPNPEYPMDIHCTTGENVVKVVGKNLWGNLTAFERSGSGMSWTNNADGSVTASGKATATTSSISSTAVAVSNNWFVTLPSGNYVARASNLSTGVMLQVFNAENGSSLLNAQGQFTLTEKTRVYARIRVESGTTVDATFNIQLELGSSASSYLPYEETTYPISLGTKEMFNINNVSDGFVYDESVDKFYINRNIGKTTLDTTGWTRSAYNDIYYFFKAKPTNCKSAVQTLSNYFIYNASYTNVDNSLYVGTNNLIIGRPIVNGSYIEELSAFTNWLGSHNTEVVYQLATSTLEEITDTTLISQLRAIKNALSMQGTTHIISTSSGTNLPFLIKARAVQTIERT